MGESVCGNGRGKTQPGSGRDLVREDSARRHRGHHNEHQLREGKGPRGRTGTVRDDASSRNQAVSRLLSLHFGERPRRGSPREIYFASSAGVPPLITRELATLHSTPWEVVRVVSARSSSPRSHRAYICGRISRRVIVLASGRCAGSNREFSLPPPPPPPSLPPPPRLRDGKQTISSQGDLFEFSIKRDRIRGSQWSPMTDGRRVVGTWLKNKFYDLFIDIERVGMYIDAMRRDAAKRRRKTTGHARDFFQRVCLAGDGT